MIVEDAGTTEKNPTSRMGTGPVLNVEITTSLGEKIAIDAMHPKAMLEATVVHVVITVVVTEEVVDCAETIVVVTEEAVDSAEIIVVVTEEVVDSAETIVVVTEEMEGNAEIIVVVTEEVVDSAEMSKAVNARAIVNNDRVMTDRRAENTKAAMIANPSDGTHEALVGGARKARVEIVGAEISRGVFI